ncbi:PD-(D/E)XK nuclease [Haloarcula tailed virus 2]|uniref:PD-(D/E)XK nuclease n=1 Tax=Haloarcula tailed virus 2 TaxID=2877989 RepID=A0AAE8Y0N2_9CAUD|nr:PD-(D/E)XK nuclease [Haloarcula tailed virus 2]UBF23209.1 PD-(D/E)XK nuclease [Haloarcula tailed virus 2]
MNYDSDTMGAIGEAKAFAKLAEMGYVVCVPHVHVARYDLVLEKDGVFTKVQVKTGWMDGDKFRVELRGSNFNSTGRHRSTYSEHEIDVYVLYNPELDCLYWLDFDEAPKTGIRRTLDSMEQYSL